MAMERTVGKNLTANTDNIMLEVRDNASANVVLLYVANSTSNNIAISVKWYDKSTNETYYIVNGYALSANQFIKLDGSYMKLEAGDKLICNPAGAGMSSIVTYEVVEK
jgi:TRAP-type mannitol/chloroaromatic compound transport system permease small subunit